MAAATDSNAGQPAATARMIEAVRAVARLSRFAERAMGELSPAHYRVLSAIASGDERASRVAAKLSVGKPTISASVEALSRRGLIARSSVGSDQRATALTLTEEGRLVLERAEQAMVARLGELCVRTADGGAVVNALASLGEALDITAGERSEGETVRRGAST